MLSFVVDFIYLLQIASKDVEDNIEIHMTDKEITDEIEWKYQAKQVLQNFRAVKT
jgi:hypothetical protein